ncbi:MAG: TldD/PmbA family protein [Candidatus Omnitrophota bacterium]|nr:TldD/PmbA family protein [Candidatus Omnitrophota bacterium]
MKEALRNGIKYLKNKEVDYADIRFVRRSHESLVVKNNEVENIAAKTDEGFSVRVLKRGSWGFSSCADLSKNNVEKTAQRAMAIAEATAAINKTKIYLAPVEAVKVSFKSKYETDPFEVPIHKKLEYLMSACQALKSHQNIKTALASLDFYRTYKFFLSTEGSEIEQESIESGGYVEAIAVSGDEVQRRSYPMAHSDIAQRGYEYVTELDLVGGAEGVKKEAVSLLHAKECPSKITTVILDTTQLALQIHESCGHAAELDRTFGDEVSFAGATFLSSDKLGKFRYGSKLINITADATCEGGVGTFAFDDEGVVAQKIPIVKDGIFVGYLSSREAAHKIGGRSSGAMRASSWSALPLIRMTNINLEPGESSLEELISDTKDGILLATNKTWSIDDMRLNFQFGTEIGWEIKNGKVGDVLKNPFYTGITPDFWASCSGIANSKYWKLHGIPNCGKGEPGQVMHVGHGASPARFENVQVGKKR